MIRFLKSARAEFEEIVAHYEAKVAGLGSEFALEVQQGLARIGEFPYGWQRLGPRVRRYRLTRFPYSLVYAPLPGEITVVAVMHFHQAPGYWRRRLKEL
jgi:toxin ParE2